MAAPHRTNTSLPKPAKANKKPPLKMGLDAVIRYWGPGSHTAKKAEPLTFWQQIVHDFGQCENVVSGWSLPSDLEVRKFKAALKTNWKLAKGGLDGGFSDGFKLIPLTDGRLIEMWATFKTLGVNIPEDVTKRIPSHLQVCHHENARPIIEAAISSEEITEDFILAWGAYKQAVGVFMMFMRDKEIEAHYKANILNNLPDAVENTFMLTLYIELGYKAAERGTTQKKSSLKKIDDMLSRPTALNEYELKALKNMFLKGESVLKETYRRMKPREIEQIIRENIIPPNLLKTLD